MLGTINVRTALFAAMILVIALGAKAVANDSGPKTVCSEPACGDPDVPLVQGSPGDPVPDPTVEDPEPKRVKEAGPSADPKSTKPTGLCPDPAPRAPEARPALPVPDLGRRIDRCRSSALTEAKSETISGDRKPAAREGNTAEKGTRHEKPSGKVNPSWSIAFRHISRIVF